MPARSARHRPARPGLRVLVGCGAAGGIASTQFPEKPDVKSTPPPQARENRVQVSSYGAMIPEIDGAKQVEAARRNLEDARIAGAERIAAAQEALNQAELDGARQVADAREQLRRADLVCQPGQCYQYQNVAFSLLAPVVEAIEAMDAPVLLPFLFIPDGQALAKRLGKRLRFANESGAKDQFRAGDLPVLAFNPESMAHGIDGLQGASNTVFWFGATYRYDWHHQVYKRLHRDGQKAGTVFVRRFIAERTIEERIIREVLVPRGEQNDGLLRALRP